MSFREKSAWINLGVLLAVFGIYFGALVTGRVRHGLESLHLLLWCVGGFVVLQAALTAAAAMTTPGDGRGPLDERERLIQMQSESLGYRVLVWLVLGLFVPIHFGHSALDMANFGLLGLVIAGLVVAVAQIVMFRRGA